MHITSNSNLKSYSIAIFKRSLVVAKKHPENTVNGHGNQKNPCFTAGKERNKKGKSSKAASYRKSILIKKTGAIRLIVLFTDINDAMSEKVVPCL